MTPQEFFELSKENIKLRKEKDEKELIKRDLKINKRDRKQAKDLYNKVQKELRKAIRKGEDFISINLTNFYFFTELSESAIYQTVQFLKFEGWNVVTGLYNLPGFRTAKYLDVSLPNEFMNEMKIER